MFFGNEGITQVKILSCIYLISFGFRSVTSDLLNLSSGAEGSSEGPTELVRLLFMELHMSPNLPAPVAKQKNT